MKNFIQRETLNFPGYDLEDYCRFLADLFLETYPQVEGVQVSATEIPYRRCRRAMWRSRRRPGARHRPDRTASRRRSSGNGRMRAAYGLPSAAPGRQRVPGFVRDQYTTLPDIRNRPLHMWLDLEWLYTDPAAAYSARARSRRQVRRIVSEIFQAFESGSIQQMIYQMGTRCWPRSRRSRRCVWKGEQSNLGYRGRAAATTLGVYHRARPPYGCLGLSLRR